MNATITNRSKYSVIHNVWHHYTEIIKKHLVIRLFHTLSEVQPLAHDLTYMYKIKYVLFFPAVIKYPPAFSKDFQNAREKNFIFTAKKFNQRKTDAYENIVTAVEYHRRSSFDPTEKPLIHSGEIICQRKRHFRFIFFHNEMPFWAIRKRYRKKIFPIEYPTTQTRSFQRFSTRMTVLNVFNLV